MVIKRLVSLCVAVVCLGGAAPLGTTSAAPPFFRNPVVLSIAPDTVDCDNPDDPDHVEDVQIAGICVFGAITSAQTIFTNSAVTVGFLNINNSGAVTINDLNFFGGDENGDGGALAFTTGASTPRTSTSSIDSIYAPSVPSTAATSASEWCPGPR